MNLYQPTITGSLSVSGSVNISGSITIEGGGTISGTASIATTALTASSADNFLVRNTLTAQTLVVQTITSSVDFVTGSTRFGSISANTHVFTGSVSITGSFVGIGSPSFYNAKLNIQKSSTESQPNEQIRMQSTGGTVPSTWRFDVGANSGSFAITDNSVGERLTITSAGDVVINDTVANTYAKLQVTGLSSSNITLGLANPAAAAAGVGSSIWFYGTTGYNTQGLINAAWDGASNSYAYMAFHTRGPSTTERMRITSSGSVGIGTTTPSFQLDVFPGVASTTIRAGSYAIMQNVTTNQAMFGLNVAYATSIGTGWRYINTDYATAIRMYSGDIIFHLASSGTAGTQPANWDTTDAKMTIKNGGNVLIGSTSDQGNWKAQVTGNFLVRGSSTGAVNAIYVDNSSGYELFSVRNDGFFRTGTQASAPYNFTTAGAANCLIDTDGALRRSTSSLKYKTDVRDYDKGLTEVLQMRPVYYKGKNDGETQFAGLIAEEIHDLELTEFVQYAEDGTPDALHYQNMIALLTKAIQELKAEFDVYKATHP
jgi:hypothetical protein